jgi:hypothetical protein
MVRGMACRRDWGLTGGQAAGSAWACSGGERFPGGCYRTDPLGDQLSGALALEMHARRREFLEEHVGLVVEPSSRGTLEASHSSRHEAPPATSVAG